MALFTCSNSKLLRNRQATYTRLCCGLLLSVLAAITLVGCDITPSPSNPSNVTPPGDGNGNGNGTGQPIPGLAGPQGEQGQAGLDGTDGAQGPQGTTGIQGTTGVQGEAGPAGQNGADGLPGLPGQTGGTGPAGPTFFDVFIDSFLVPSTSTTNTGQLSLAVEPTLGLTPSSAMFRIAIPPIYDSGNDVAARLFLSRSDAFIDGCFVFAVDITRNRDGMAAQPYGDTRWVRVDALDDFATFNGDVSTAAVDAGLSMVIDIPLNTNAGLTFPNDLAAGDLLTFQLTTFQGDGRSYDLLGVELYETTINGASLRNANVFSQIGDITCDRCLGTGVDCNNNGSPDDCDIAFGVSMDCNRNGTPDECELCEPSPPPAPQPLLIATTPFNVLWWDSTAQFDGEAPDALRQEMADFLTNFNGGSWFNTTFVSSQSPGTLATHLATNTYDVIVFDATQFSTDSSSYNTRDLDALIAHYTNHANVLLDGSLYLRNVNISAGTVFPGPNGATGRLLANEVFQLGARGGGVMIGTAHDCCHSDANLLLDAIVSGASFAGRAIPSPNGQFNSNDLTNAIATFVPADVFTHWLSAPSEAIAPTGVFTDVLGNAVLLASQVNVSSLSGSTGVSFISTSWQPGTVAMEHDCNANGLLDLLDLDRNTSDDCNANGILDECEVFCVEPPPVIGQN